jgi:hypothetical protein
MSFRGSCHCGRLAYTVDEAPPAKAMECNCSICRRKGALHHFTTPDKFRREASDDDILVYRFNKHIIRHMFCKTCGCAPFAQRSRGSLFDLRFLELDVLARDGVIFAEGHLLGDVPRILLGHVEEAGVGGADELDLDRGRLGHDSLSKMSISGSLVRRSDETPTRAGSNKETG